MSSLHQKKRVLSSGKLYAKLDDYQKHAVEFAIKQKGVGLFFEQGTGKTWIAAGIVERLLSQTPFFGLFIVKLANIETTWAKIFAEQLPQVKIARSFEAFRFIRKNFPHQPVVLLLHYEAVPKNIKALRKSSWTLIVYDESQGLKARGTIASRTAAKLSRSAEYRVALSGTPIDKQPQDLWAQFRFFAPDVLGTRWADFEERWLEPIDIDLTGVRRNSYRYMRLMRAMMIRRGKRKFDEAKLPEFLSLIEPYALRVTKDVLNLPPLTVIGEQVKLRGDQARVYDDIAKTMMSARLNTTAPLKVTQIGKLQQVCGGYLIDDDQEVHCVGRAKLRRLLQLIERHRRTSPIVIFCKYLEEVRAIADELGHLRVATLTGKIKKGDRPQIIDDFQAGKIDVLVSQIKTGGVGIDLFRANICIFFSLTYSFIDFEQAISRLHRRGQEKEVMAFILYAMDTIDSAIRLSIIRKRKVSEAVLTHLQRRYTWQKQRRRSVSPSWLKSSPSSPRPLASSSALLASRKTARPTAGTRPVSRPS